MQESSKYATMHSYMKTPELRTFLGWDRPAIELVAEHLYSLLTHPDKQVADAYRRATVVVPTSGSGRRLREYMAELSKERAGKPILMPKITLAGQLIPSEGENVATETETLAAWLHVLEHSDMWKQAPHLFASKPMGNTERWLTKVAEQLMNLRARLEQDGVDVQSMPAKVFEYGITVLSDNEDKDSQQKEVYETEKHKWQEIISLYDDVDRLLMRENRIPKEERRARAIRNIEWNRHGKLLILACVPELSRQVQKYVHMLRDSGAVYVSTWINAPKELKHTFDEYGLPLQSEWEKTGVDIPNALVLKKSEDSLVHDTEASCVHIMPGAREVAEKAVELSGGYDSKDVALFCCDPEFTPTLHTEFLLADKGSWKLNIPEGRSMRTTDVCLIPQLLVDAAQLPLYDEKSGQLAHNSSKNVEAFIALLNNPCLQRLYSPHSSSQKSFSLFLERIVQTALPGSIDALVGLIKKAAECEDEKKESEALAYLLKKYKSAAKEFLIYTEKIQSFVKDFREACTLISCSAELAKKIKKHSTENADYKKAIKAVASVFEDIGKLPAFAKELSTGALGALVKHNADEAMSGELKLDDRESTVGDIQGWRELTYSTGKRIIITAMHSECIPEPVSGNAFLPESLCEFCNMPRYKSRTARDTFMLQALIQGHKKHANCVQFVLAHRKADGTPLAPSSLLLPCDKPAELALRTSIWFDDKTTPVPPKPREKCYLKEITQTLTKEQLLQGEMESISLLVGDTPNPFADGAAKPRTYSPSLLSAFLSCPLRFWLSKLLNLNPSDEFKENKIEPAANEYGIIMHAVVQQLTGEFRWISPSNRTTEAKDEWIKQVNSRAEALLDTELVKLYGQRFSVPLKFNRRIMTRSLMAFAVQLIEDLYNGWCIIAREITMEPEMTLSDGSTAKFSMKADRIDRHESGKWRIIDYKTSNKAKEPTTEHWEKVDAEDCKFSTYMNAGKLRFPLLEFEKETGELTCIARWKNVQLPLYAYGLKHISKDKLLEDITENAPGIKAMLPDIAIIQQECNNIPEQAYYNIRSNTQQVVYSKLMNADEIAQLKSDRFRGKAETLLRSAWETTKSAIELIRAGKCLYSAESLVLASKSYNTFGALAATPDPRTMFNLTPLS